MIVFTFVRRLATISIAVSLGLASPAVAERTGGDRPPAASPAGVKMAANAKRPPIPRPKPESAAFVPPSSFTAAVPSPHSLSAADRAVTLAAMEAAEAGRWAKAAETAAGASSRLPAKLIAWLSLQQFKSAHSFEEIAQFIEQNPDWPAQETLRRRAEEAMDAAISDARVLQWFAERKPVTGEGHVRFAEALLNTGKTEDAIAWLREGWVKGNFAVRDEGDILRQHEGLLRDIDHNARLDRLLWERDVNAARRMLKWVDAGHRALAEARLALITRASDVDRRIAKVPVALKDDGGLAYDRLRWRREKGRDDGVEEILFAPPGDLGRANQWWNERQARARAALSQGRMTDAYRLAAGHGAVDARSVAEAEWLAGWLALRFLDDHKAALSHFLRLRDTVRMPISRARAGYWAGRAAEAGSDKVQAAELYREAAEHPTTFYGQLALLKLGRRGPLEFPDTPVLSPAVMANFEARELTKVTRLLAEIGQWDRLRQFILRLHQRTETPEEHLALITFAASLGRPELAVAAAKRASHDGFLLVEGSYPVLSELTQSMGPEAALVHAVSRQESEFNVAAISSAGARGLMQLMPRTARQVARALEIRYQTDRLTTDAAYNARLGAHYLGSLLERWDGSYILALASYNAGETRVRRWVAEWGDPRKPDVDPIDWIELIPFNETRNYVQRVLEGLQVYRQLLDEAGKVRVRLDRDLRSAPHKES